MAPPRDRSRDLSTGPIPQHFRALAVPMAIGMVFSTLYNVVDVYFAGMLSTQAQAGLAITFQAFFVLIAVGVGLSSAMGALIGNALGARDRARARAIAVQGLGFGVIASVLLGLIGIWGAPALLSLISVPGGYREAAIEYVMVLLFGTGSFLIAFGANGILSAQGDTVSMQRAQIAAFFANVVLNPLFIFGIPGVVGGIGFNGIALSTVVSQTGVMTFILYRVLTSDLMREGPPQPWAPSLAAYREITAQAMPTTFAMLIMLIAGFVVQFYLKGFGAAAVAGYGIALRIEQLLLLPGFGLTGALLPIAARNFGAGQFDRVRAALFFCFRAGVAIMLVASALLWVAARPAMAIFTDDPEVIAVGVSYLHVDGFILPLYILLFAMNSFMQALKRPILSVWVGLYRQGVAVALFVWLFVVVLEQGVWGVWYGVAVSVATGLMLSFWVTSRLAAAKIGGLWPTATVAA
jgi:putative MATE family efflux protein